MTLNMYICIHKHKYIYACSFLLCTRQYSYTSNSCSKHESLPAIFIDVLSKTMTTLSQYSWIRDQDYSRAPTLLLSHPVPFAIITVIIITTNIHTLCRLVWFVFIISFLRVFIVRCYSTYFLSCSCAVPVTGFMAVVPTC